MKIIKKAMIVVFFCFGLLFSMTVFADTDNTQLVIARDAVNQAILDQADSKYESTSYSAFSSGLTALGGIPAVDAMIVDALALQVDIDQMTLDLNNLLAGLVTSDTYDATMLLYLTEKARVTTSYTLRSKSVYNDELNRIKDIIDNPTVGEIAVQNLTTDIAAVSSLLILLGNKTDLQVNYDLAEAIYLDGSSYIPSTAIAFQSAYAAIDATLTSEIGFTKLEVLNNTDASQPEVDAALAEIESALALLIIKPDKAALIQEYDDAIALDLSIYTLDSRTLFVSGLDPIHSVILDNESLEEDVNQAMDDLSALYLLLVLKGDKTTLQTSMDELVDFNYDLYTPDSVLIFDAEMARISTVMSDDNTTIAMMDLLSQNFDDAFSLLVTRADKTALTISNNMAIIAYYEEKSEYTASSYALFKAEVLNYGSYLYVNQVISDNNALQSNVDLLNDQIESALSLLEPLVDNSVLLNIYTSEGIFDSTLYTPASIELFNDEYQRIHTVIVGKELSQSAYDQILIDLENVQGLFVLKADTSALVALYNSLSNKSEETYSVSSYAYFSEIMADASTVILNENATQTEVDDEIVALEEAVLLLQKKSNEISINVKDAPFNVNAFVTTGSATILSYDSSNEEVLTVDAFGNVSGHSFGHASVEITLSNGVIESLDFLVKSNVRPVTLILSISLPVLSISLGFGMLFLKKSHLSFLQKLMFWKKV